jgi:prolyl-tRNA editing enzyme YbaK/EbsC (Cys-tRNA(Pro) deacylase)
MTVKILTASQKGAVKLLYSHKRKNTKELAMALGVSERTIQRSIEEEAAKNPGLIDSSAEAKQVMALLYKHKITYEQLVRLLQHPVGMLSPVTSQSIQEYLCKATKEELATLFFTAGMAKLMEVVIAQKAVQDQIQSQPNKPTLPIPKSAQEPLDLGVKQ